MSEGAIDRRVFRTRRMLHKALMSLILRKRYEAITITDICETANVGRSTFYAHYASKDDLKRGGLDNLRKRLAQETLAKSGRMANEPLGFSLAMFEHARDHIDHYKALAGTHGGTVALGHIRQIISDFVRADVATVDQSLSGIPRDLAVQHIVGAYMSMLTWWLDHGARMPADQIDAAFRRLALHGMMASPPR